MRYQFYYKVFFMDIETSNTIIGRYDLIKSKQSRRILSAIRLDGQIKASDLPQGITLEQIEQLRQSYKKQKSDYPHQPKQPRNQIFYDLIKQRFPAFHWECNDKNVLFKTIKALQLEPSLLSLLLSSIPKSDDTYLTQKYENFLTLPRSLTTTLDRLFRELQIVYPSKEDMGKIIQWLQYGLQGKPLTLCSFSCGATLAPSGIVSSAPTFF